VTETFVHATAEVDASAELGDGCQVWNWTKVREGAVLGSGTKLGQGVYIDRGVRLGAGCKVQNGVSLYAGVSCGDYVFVGPNATFTNDRVPRAAAGDAWVVIPTRLENHASVGANATILCGITLGRGCVVGAGAVVIEDVPAFAVVVGAPARVVGYVDLEGNRISAAPGEAGTAHG
jgi:acetyltransferase-like isoleucine patch superfamily enzyme